MTTQQTRVPSNEETTIINGPSEDDFFNALRYGRLKRRTILRSADGLDFEVDITSVGRSSGFRDGYSFWRVKGFALDPKGTVTDRKWRPFAGTYRTADRLGTIKLAD